MWMLFVQRVTNNSMMVIGNFSVVSNKFAVIAPNTFHQLWNDKGFLDVTLASSDDQQIKVHKAILSSSSSFFKIYC